MARNINMCIYEDYKVFLQYYKEYLRYYKRKLSPKSYYTEHNTSDDTFAYAHASEAKQNSNTWYNQRYKLLTPDDQWLTVIYANSHRYTMAGTYTRRLFGLYVTVFAVITQHTVHEWYINGAVLSKPAYIGRVPPWRTYYHWWKVDCDLSATDDARIDDECYEEY